MTRTSGTTLIAMSFTAVAFAMLSQGASASTGDVQMQKYCASLGIEDSTACRESFTRMKRRLAVKLSDDGGGGGGDGGRGGRGGQK